MTTTPSAEWKTLDTMPTDGTIVLGLFDDGSTKLMLYSSNYYRETILVQGLGGLFWRSMVGPRPTHWQQRRPSDDAALAEVDRRRAEALAEIEVLTRPESEPKP